MIYVRSEIVDKVSEGIINSWLAAKISVQKTRMPEMAIPNSFIVEKQIDINEKYSFIFGYQTDDEHYYTCVHLLDKKENKFIAKSDQYKDLFGKYKMKFNNDTFILQIKGVEKIDKKNFIPCCL